MGDTEFDKLVEESKALVEQINLSNSHEEKEVAEELTSGLALNKTRVFIYILGMLSAIATLIFTLLPVYTAIESNVANLILVSYLTFVATLAGIFGLLNFIKK